MGSIWTELAWTALPPLAVAAAVIAIANWLRLRPRPAWALAVGLGYLAGHLVVVGRSVGANGALAKLARPHEARDWIPLAVLVAMGVTLLASAAPRSWQRWLVGLAAIVSVGVPLRLLANSALVATQWSTGEKLAHLALLSAAMALTWLVLSTAGDDDQPRVRAMLLAIVALGAAFTVTRSGSFSYGQLCGVVGAAIGGATAISSRTTVIGVSGAAGVLTMSLGSLILLAHFYAALSVGNAVLLALSLAAAGGRLPTFVTSDHAWWQAAIRAALCLAPLVTAVVSRM